MKRRNEVLLLLAFAASSPVLAGESPPFGTAAPKEALPAFEVCRGVIQLSGSTRPGLAGGPLKANVYLSDIMARGPINDEDIRQAFQKFVGEKYGQPYGGFHCAYAYTREEAQKIRDVDMRQGLEGQTFIETGWKYAPPAKAAAPPPEHYAVCWANRTAKVKYYSAVFDGSRDDAGKWWPAFQKFLKEKYGFDGPTQCIPARGQADAQSYLKTLIDQDRKTRTMQGAPPEIVETGWKY